MIIDLDGAASEPTRRRHVMTLSAAAAAIALVVLAALFAPVPERGAPSEAAAPVPSPTAASVIVRSDVTTTACVAGSGLTPAMTVIFDRNGQPVAAYTGGAAGRFIPLRPEYWGPFSITVPCDTSDVFAPRINRAR